jgi:flavin reductase (DIM6/NTAB) family NADH-FMN oxidoreductase RutF/rubredoxin
MNKSALHKLSYGIYVLTTKADDTPFGCIINTAFQITSDPPRLAVSCNRDNFTHDKIQQAGQFAVSALAEDSDAAIIATFGYNSGRDMDKFARHNATPGSKLGLPLFPAESAATFECKLVDQIEVETHTIFIGEIVECEVSRPDADEMTYRYYHEIRKGSAPKNAPTFIAEETSDTSREQWQCDVCNYIYDGTLPFDELADNWVCPVCGATKDHFVKQAAS